MTGSTAPGADPVTEAAAAVATAVARPALADEFSGRRLFASDLRTALILLNYARHRSLQKVFGQSPQDDNVLTAVLLMILAGKFRGQLQQVAKIVPAGPAASDWFLGGGVLQELSYSVAGPASRQTPMLGPLLLFAFVVATGREPLARSLRAMRSGSHRTALGFHHRYGYLVDPGHWREQRARGRGEQPRGS